MLVVIRPMPFPKAPEERHLCRSSGATCFLGYLYATNISLLTELKPAHDLNLAPMGLQPLRLMGWFSQLLVRSNLEYAA